MTASPAEWHGVLETENRKGHMGMSPLLGCWEVTALSQASAGLNILALEHVRN